jgi:M6 family metalloprotease-like protein
MCVVCQTAMTIAATIGAAIPGVHVPEAQPIAEKPTVVEAAAPSLSSTTPRVLSGACSRPGRVRTVKRVQYVCSKSKRWRVVSTGNPRSAVPPTTTTVRASVVYQPPTQPASSIEKCQIEERNANRGRWSNALPTGFPRKTIARKTGTVKWALIPIDFPDLPGEVGFRSRVDDQMRLLSEWFAAASEGRFTVEWVVHDSWVRLSNPTTEYRIERSDNLDRVPNGLKLWREAMTQSDAVFDFSGVQTVNFLLPKGQTFMLETSQGFPWDAAVQSQRTNEGTVESFSIPGRFMDQPGRQYWSYWMHEFGHAMGLPHIGSSRVPNPFMGLDIMSSQDGESRELSGWLRYVAGWFDDDRVYCQDFAALRNADVTLIPLNESVSGIKMVVIPISETKAVIVESRRESKFSCQMPSKRNGVLTYVYDATFSHGENFLRPIVPPDRTIESSSTCPVSPYPNPILYEGDKVTVEGVTVEVLASANLDRVRISR